MEVLISLKSVFETSVQQLALSVIKWPSWGAVWPSGWVVTTNPGGRASPGANHLPCEWSKLPHLAGGRSQQNMTKLCEKLIYQVGPSHLCNKVYILVSTYGRILSFLGLMSNTWYLYDPLCTFHLFTAERCRFWENLGSSERLEATWSDTANVRLWQWYSNAVPLHDESVQDFTTFHPTHATL